MADSGRSGLRLLHGMGKVYARTWYDRTVRIPLQKQARVYTGENRSRLAMLNPSDGQAGVEAFILDTAARGAASGPAASHSAVIRAVKVRRAVSSACSRSRPSQLTSGT